MRLYENYDLIHRAAPPSLTFVNAGRTTRTITTT